MVCLAGGYDRDEIIKRSPVSRCLDSTGKIIRKRDVGFHLEAGGLIHRMADAVAKSSREG